MNVLYHIGTYAMAMYADGVRKATKYIDKNLVVKITLPAKKGGKRMQRARGVTATVTVGRPNYLERKFIAQCKKAGEKLPVRKVQLKRFA